MSEALVTTEDVYDAMPLTERTLLKWLRRQPETFAPWRVSNDKGSPCDWFVYRHESADPCAVVLYRGGRKLCVHGI
jgi:hypothetical protein